MTMPSCPRISASFDSTQTQLGSFYGGFNKKPPLSEGLICFQSAQRACIRDRTYFLAGSALAYFRRKRSTRPAVSISFCLPVKNGWQFEQISTPMSPLWVERVIKVLPHAQCTRTSL